MLIGYWIQKYFWGKLSILILEPSLWNQSALVEIPALEQIIFQKKKKWGWWKLSWGFHEYLACHFIWGLRIAPGIHSKDSINGNYYYQYHIMTAIHVFKKLSKTKLIKFLYCITSQSRQCAYEFPRQGSFPKLIWLEIFPSHLPIPNQNILGDLIQE